jgi:hypothetical protein
MRKLLFFSIIILTALACKKTKFSPEGPTDVRVKNLSDLPFLQVIVNTSGGIDTLGDVNAGGVTEYFRFGKAFSKADISAKVNNQLFSTGAVDYYALTYIGQARITYSVFIKSMTDKILEISNVSLDAPLD